MLSTSLEAGSEKERLECVDGSGFSEEFRGVQTSCSLVFSG